MLYENFLKAVPHIPSLQNLYLIIKIYVDRPHQSLEQLWAIELPQFLLSKTRVANAPCLRQIAGLASLEHDVDITPDSVFQVHGGDLI